MSIYLRITAYALVCIGCLSGLVPAQAQVQMQEQVSVDGVLTKAQEVLKALDAAEAGAVWDRASEVLKKSVEKEKFAKAFGLDRSSQSVIKSRAWGSIARTRHLQGNANGLAPGTYINIQYSSADGAGTPVTELLSFRLEEDGIWRMTGYVAQKAAAK